VRLLKQQRVTRLPLYRHTDRKLVVLADEHARSLEDAREVERGVEIRVTRGAVAQKRQGDVVATTLTRRQCHAYRLRQLRRDAARPRHHVHRARALMTRHLPTFGDVERAREVLREVTRQGKAAHQHHVAFTQRRKDPIAVAQRQSCRHGRHLLSGARAVEADAPLALQLDQALVEQPHAP
jgi:hypothetical protein